MIWVVEGMSKGGWMVIGWRTDRAAIRRLLHDCKWNDPSGHYRMSKYVREEAT